MQRVRNFCSVCILCKLGKDPNLKDHQKGSHQALHKLQACCSFINPLLTVDKQLLLAASAPRISLCLFPFSVSLSLSFYFLLSFLLYLLKYQNQSETPYFESKELIWIEYNDLNSGSEDLDANGKEMIPGYYGRPTVCREAYRTEGEFL